MASFTKFQKFVEHLAEKVHNLGSDALRLALTNAAPIVASDGSLSNITQIAGGTGYTTDGMSITTSASAQSGGTYKLTIADVVLTAAGAVGPFRYAVLFNHTAYLAGGANDIIGYWDYGASVTMGNGEAFTFDFDAAGGVLTLA